ncbi:hypothetical protein [Photobacterium galatheae]|uniref:Uncharacterized protein n=1 Tax=Photobacterium galatheae TaxID=1654360 RepID=A0A066RKQ6_9GAMM|nr:hypothetical protein [Photobacterium galatheae]KDM91035.1 hypothetical protein EA58_14905 [Photobacterium galatheae]MCM0149013.1 hypothetical protein [Photobacterium galatheae]
MSTNVVHEIDLNVAQSALYKIIDSQKSAIQSAKDVIRNSSEMQRQADDLDASLGNTELQLSTSMILKAERTIRACVDSLHYIRINEFGLCRKCWDDIEYERLNKTPYLIHCSSCSKDEELVGRHIIGAR